MAFVPAYILIILLTIVVDYFAGIYIEKSEGKRRKQFLVLSIISNLSILGVFKYYNFFNANFGRILFHFNFHDPLPLLKMLLPIGLSFHTFQAMSYTIEVYRGNQKAEKHFGIYWLYVMFFPQMVAGPIERPQHLIHQFYEKHYFKIDNVVSGLRLILWGFLKKVVIADGLAHIVTDIYSYPDHFPGSGLLLGTLCFTFQIYYDFSGYSDIARGTALVLGFSIMQNFETPYLSSSVSEFWGRWHISLSSWFRDYVYIPLGGSRVKLPRQFLNILIVFVLSGLWHGASWTFVIWGCLNGLYLIIELSTSGIRKKLFNNFKSIGAKFIVKSLGVVITFLLIMFSWIFFRSSNLHQAAYIIKHIGKGITQPFDIYGIDAAPGLLGFILLSILIVITHWVDYKGGLTSLISHKPIVIRWATYSLILWVIFILGVFHEQVFIYFAF